MGNSKKILENRKFQIVIMLSCFILSAVFLILFISQIYSFAVPDNPPINKINNPDNQSKISSTNPPINPPAKNDFFKGIPKGSPLMFVVFLIGMLVSFSAGLVLYNLLNIKDKKEIKKKIIEEMLLPEEKLIVELLEKNQGEATQKELTLNSNFNKLKVSRVIKRLESLNLIEKFPYGMTNKIKLK